MLLRCLHDAATDPLRFMPTALRFTTAELRMPTYAQDVPTIRYGASTIQAGSATTSSLYYIPDESGWIVMNLAKSGYHWYQDSPRLSTNDPEYTYGAATNEPDAATVELRFRPRPQSTTNRPECFKRFKIVVALSWRFPNRQDSSRIATVLLRFTPMSTVLLRIMPMHPIRRRFDKLGWIVALPGPKILNV